MVQRRRRRSHLHRCFKKIIFKPNLPLDLRWVHASVNTISGLVEIKTVKRDNGVEVEVNVPVNSTAVLYIPKYNIKKPALLEGDKLLYSENAVKEKVEGIHSIVEEKDAIIIKLGSGTYSFYLKEKLES